MEWSEVLQEPTLQNLPYKVELTRGGTLEMTPASNKHGRIQARLTYLLAGHLPEGEVVNECSILTEEGVKVADVAWCSTEFVKQNGYDTPYRHAPEICVEITSPSNSREELQRKVGLYLAQGAVEVWVIREDGEVRVFGKEGELPQSAFGLSVKL